jgi:hypothetical protein
MMTIRQIQEWIRAVQGSLIGSRRAVAVAVEFGAHGNGIISVGWEWPVTNQTAVLRDMYEFESLDELTDVVSGRVVPPWEAKGILN